MAATEMDVEAVRGRRRALGVPKLSSNPSCESETNTIFYSIRKAAARLPVDPRRRGAAL